MIERVIVGDKPFAKGGEDETPDAAVWVDAAAFDAAWRTTDQYIVPGGSNGQDDCYVRVGRWFAANRHCRRLDAAMGGEEVAFIGGRHRFSWLRDQGGQAVPLQMNPALGAVSVSRLQAKILATVLRLKVQAQGTDDGTHSEPADVQ